jgi:hypothetical protein
MVLYHVGFGVLSLAFSDYQDTPCELFLDTEKKELPTTTLWILGALSVSLLSSSVVEDMR